MPTPEQVSISEIVSRLKVLSAAVNSAVYGDHDIMQLAQAMAGSGKLHVVFAEALQRAAGTRK